jgi:hypothetical protein
MTSGQPWTGDARCGAMPCSGVSEERMDSLLWPGWGQGVTVTGVANRWVLSSVGECQLSEGLVCSRAERFSRAPRVAGATRSGLMLTLWGATSRQCTMKRVACPMKRPVCTERRRAGRAALVQRVRAFAWTASHSDVATGNARPWRSSDAAAGTHSRSAAPLSRLAQRPTVPGQQDQVTGRRLCSAVAGLRCWLHVSCRGVLLGRHTTASPHLRPALAGPFLNHNQSS